MSKKKQLEYLRNCSNKKHGMNDTKLYLAVEIWLVQNLNGWGLLIKITRWSSPPFGTNSWVSSIAAAGSPSSSEKHTYCNINRVTCFDYATVRAITRRFYCHYKWATVIEVIYNVGNYTFTLIQRRHTSIFACRRIDSDKHTTFGESKIELTSNKRDRLLLWVLNEVLIFSNANNKLRPRTPSGWLPLKIAPFP